MKVLVPVLVTLHTQVKWHKLAAQSGRPVDVIHE